VIRKALSKKRLAGWLRECIAQAYGQVALSPRPCLLGQHRTGEEVGGVVGQWASDPLPGSNVPEGSRDGHGAHWPITGRKGSPHLPGGRRGEALHTIVQTHSARGQCLSVEHGYLHSPCGPEGLGEVVHNEPMGWGFSPSAYGQREGALSTVFRAHFLRGKLIRVRSVSRGPDFSTVTTGVKDQKSRSGTVGWNGIVGRQCAYTWGLPLYP